MPATCPQVRGTSPGVCNAILLRMDRRLGGLAKKHGFAYTRYADDLTFSGPSEDAAHQLRRAAERVIRDEGFALNQAKTRAQLQGMLAWIHMLNPEQAEALRKQAKL